MQPLHHQEYWAIEVEWSRPKVYENVLSHGSEHDEYSNLYLISARFSTNTPKLLYIGKTFDQWVSKRLSQPDHIERHDKFLEHYSRHKLFVSHGYITVHGGRLTRQRLDDIERILIYTAEPAHAHNVKNFNAHGVRSSYRIENKGYKCTLPRVVTLGVFVSY